MFKTFKEYLKPQVIKEDLITLMNLLELRDGYDIEIKNVNALNSSDEINSLVLKINRGNIDKLIKQITSIYNFKAEKEENKVVVFTKN